MEYGGEAEFLAGCQNQLLFLLPSMTAWQVLASVGTRLPPESLVYNYKYLARYKCVYEYECILRLCVSLSTLTIAKAKSTDTISVPLLIFFFFGHR